MSIPASLACGEGDGALCVPLVPLMGLDTHFSGSEPLELLHRLRGLSHQARRNPSPVILWH